MEKDVEDEKDESKKGIIMDKKKALLFQRFVAFCIDMLLISFVASLISTPFMDTDKIEKLEQQEIEIVQNYREGTIDMETYLIEYPNLNYKLARNSGILSIVTILLEVLYFAVYPVYRKGQTFGKKLMKIRVVSEDGDSLTMNQMIFRSFLANFILMHLISFIFMLSNSKDVYFYSVGIVEIIQYVIVFLSAIMIMRKKDGRAIHDKLVHTTVIREN